jgi:hypothetical protein
MCVVGATTTGAREPVCVHRNAPDERAGATRSSPMPRGLSRSGEAKQQFPWKRRGAVACFGARPQAVKQNVTELNEGKDFHVV